MYCCIWHESGFSHREDVFTYRLIYKDMFIKCSTLRVICKDTAAINHFNYKHKQGSFLSTMMGLTMLVLSF
jgi:hypothetical protein